MNSVDAIVIGGGIAGLAAAYHLTRAPGLSVVLLEREPVLAAHSSGNNAAIFRPLETRLGIAALAERTRQLLDALMGGSSAGWLRPTGLLLVAAQATFLGDLAALAQQRGVRHALMERRDLERLVPVLSGGEAATGLFVPDAGVTDVHAVITRLADAVRAAGGSIATGCDVARVRVDAGHVEGVELASGESIATPVVVIAAGAWAASLGAASAAPLPLTPLRRHLAHLDAADRLSPSTPVVWRLDDEVYFREESRGLLASPCDEDPWAAGVPPCDPGALELLAAKLGRLAPSFERAAVRRAWACLRTFTPDRTPVAGADPRVRGLFWLAGLGGSGLAVGVAAGEVVAAVVRGQEHPLGAILTPARAATMSGPPPG